ncbi:MAG TPA: response regulator [Ramlibacter sp.]|uniref:response regulator n=1 Tax=Ramlibacter sp. TaxID=1917967 RepID=UPI002D115018|nr:response regulator [Ramlibacter sp.]HVZ43232.1 response regulator [Ramlibacter sp.]
MSTRPLTTHEESVPRILVVDDMPDNLFLMNGLLEDLYEVVPASSGREALQVIMSDAPPDMVLLDIMMPDMDGYEVLRRIRQHTPTANIPVIFVTALASQQERNLGLELGAIDYLTKPVAPEQVIRRLEKHVRATREARRLEELSERMSRYLTPDAWQRLFHGADRATIRFEERTLTVLYAETTSLHAQGERERDAFTAEVNWLVTRYGAQMDPFVFGGAVAFFDDARACVRMSMDLQRTATAMRLRVGVHTGVMVMATFACEGRRCVTLLGAETNMAARVAAQAASGSIVISPQTYALVQDDLHANSTGCLLTEEFFQDSDLAQACLTPAPLESSTFAGLGLT